MPSVLVVGGAGYIGSHMLLALTEAGWQAEAFDNLSRGWRESVGNLPLHVGDIREPAQIEACLEERAYDAVMHFAAYAYVGESVQSPAEYYVNNVLGSLNLLEAMRRTGHRRLVFSSTCAVYGHPRYQPLDEEHPQSPVNPYGWSKLMVERMLMDYAGAHGLSSISLRYFNAAGCDHAGRAGEKHQPETHLIPLVLAEALRLIRGGHPDATALKVFGDDFPTDDGTCIRDYIHVNDLCAAHLLAADRLMRQSEAGAEAFNLGNGRGYSVLQVIEACRKVTGQDIKYAVSPRRPGDPASLVGSADLARRTLGWAPSVRRLEDIVESAWRWALQQEEIGK